MCPHRPRRGKAEGVAFKKQTSEILEISEVFFITNLVISHSETLANPTPTGESLPATCRVSNPSRLNQAMEQFSRFRDYARLDETLPRGAATLHIQAP